MLPPRADARLARRRPPFGTGLAARGARAPVEGDRGGLRRGRGRLARRIESRRAAEQAASPTLWLPLRAGPPSFFKAKAPEAAVARSRAAADVRASLRALGRARSDRAKVDGIAALVRMTISGPRSEVARQDAAPFDAGCAGSPWRRRCCRAWAGPRSCAARARVLRRPTSNGPARRSARPTRARGDVEIVAEAVLGVIRGGESDFHGALVEALGRACRLAPRRAAGPHAREPRELREGRRRAPPQVQEGGKNPAIAVERKYDGQSAAIHRTASGEVRIFSRKNNDDGQVPDVVEYVNAAAPRGVAFCLDAEIVPVGEDNKPRAFQELSTRKRVDVAAAHRGV